MIKGLAIAALVLAASLWAEPARAVLPPSAYEEARKTADHHVQITLDRVKGPGAFSAYGACFAKGEVAVVFKGSLAVGERAWFRVDCVKQSAEPPPGPQLWVALDALRDSQVIEVYLNDRPGGGLDVASWQLVLLNSVTDEPRCPVDTRGFC